MFLSAWRAVLMVELAFNVVILSTAVMAACAAGLCVYLVYGLITGRL
jgi:hypothetical protein